MSKWANEQMSEWANGQMNEWANGQMGKSAGKHSYLHICIFAYLHIWALLAILLVGLALRLYALDSIPPGLFFDEAGKGLDAQAILRGEWPIFFPYSGGKEPLFMYLVAGLFLVFGQSGLAIRLASALCGTATLLTTYLLAREMFTPTPALPRSGGGSSRGSEVIALLATLWLAVFYPAIHFSRVGFRAGSVALFETLAFWLFWRGWNAMQHRAVNSTRDGGRRPPASEWGWFALSGVALGLSLYTYPTSRFVPLVLAGFVLFQLTSQVAGRRSQVSNAPFALDVSHFTFHVSRFTFYVLLTAAVASLVFLPLGAYYLTHWAEFTARAAQVSIFNPALNHGDPWGTLVGNLLKTAGMFALQGDPNWTHNLPGRPLLDPFTFLLFVAGLLLCLWRWKQPSSQFLLLWFAIMLAPGLIAADLVPHFPRQTALLPALAIFAAYATVQIGLWLRRLQTPKPKPQSPSNLQPAICNLQSATCNLRPASGIWAIVVLLALGVITAVNAHDYFIVWAKSEENYLAFDGHNVELANYLNRLPADDHTYLLLIPARYPSYIEGQPHRHLTIDFLYRGSAPHVYVPVSEATTPAQLAAVCRERQSPVAIEWTVREFLDADPKGLARYLLGKYGVRTGIDAGRGWAVSFFDVPDRPDTFAIAETLAPYADNFGYQVTLTGATVGAAGQTDALTTTVPSGGHVWVAARWQKTAAADADYSAFFYLRDAGGHLIAQASQALLDDDHQPVTRWVEGAENWGYAILPVFPGTPPGVYTVTVGLYDPATGRRHGRFDEAGQLAGTEAPVGAITVVPPATPPAPDAVPVAHPLQVRFSDAPGLELLGYELAGDTFAPGTTVPIALTWRAASPIAADYRVRLTLLDATGKAIAATAGPAASDAHPTTRWRAGETWTGWLDLRLPAAAPAGDAMLLVSLVDAAGHATAPAPLVPLRIQGRSHTFDVPTIEHPFRATFGATIELLGYQITKSQSPSPNSQSPNLPVYQLTLYWRCLAPMSASYTVFTHLLDETGQQRGQRDSIPCGGTCPTTGWLVGEVLTDTYEIAVAPGAPPGVYTIAVGWYDASTGRRLPTDNGDRVLLPVSWLLRE